MAGVCPKCISYQDEGTFCPVCNSALLSPMEWKNRRTELITTKGDMQIAKTSASSAAEKTSTLDDKKEYILGFFFSALLFFFAFLSFYFFFGYKLEF